MIELKLLETRDGNITFPIEKTFSIIKEGQEIRQITLGINPDGQVIIRNTPYKHILFDYSVGKWNYNAVTPFTFVFHDEAVAFLNELTEIIQFTEYLESHEEILW